jgi:hypothetical protein
MLFPVDPDSQVTDEINDRFSSSERSEAGFLSFSFSAGMSGVSLSSYYLCRV